MLFIDIWRCGWFTGVVPVSFGENRKKRPKHIASGHAWGTIQRCICLVIAIAAMLCWAGCCSHTDLTRTDDVQHMGILGQHFQTTRTLDLLKDKPSCTLRLVTSNFPSYPRNKRIGVVDADTELEVNQVIRVKELVAILYILPEYYTWKCTIAKVKDGPFAGKEIAVAGNGLLLDDTAKLGSVYFTAPEAVESGNSRAK
jgi:hypothetical protein